MKQAFFFIDDTIWCLRDVTRQRPASLWDNGFFAMLKRAHDEYAMTVQLNLFYRTDFWYDSDEFNLTMMTDAYKSEFEAASDWLRFAFHAKQEFPDYPYINSTYDDVKGDYTAVKNEIIRFAGEKSLSDSLVIHWMPMSKEGCRALRDCGVRIVSPTHGDARDYTEAKQLGISQTHIARMMHRRTPEARPYVLCKFDKKTPSLCGHNHITEEEFGTIKYRNRSIKDEYSGLSFLRIGGGPCLNNNTKEQITERIGEMVDEGAELIGICVHEQYYYPDYAAYIPEYAERVYLYGELMQKYGFTFITAKEFEN